MKKRIPLAGLVLVSVIGAWAVAQHITPHPAGAEGTIRTGMTDHAFQAEVTRDVSGKYALFLPEQYGKDNIRLPLILFLHGSGERGVDLEKVKKLGVPRVAMKQKGFPFIVLAPQCPPGRWWTDIEVTEMVMAMLDEVTEKYLVDTDRIYLTGLSMGGFGTWWLAQQYPDRFAAIVPVCGGGNPYLNERLIDMPTKVYHGAKDTAVPAMLSQQMVNALRMFAAQKKLRPPVELIIYPDRGHDAWTPAYDDTKLYEWLMQQTLSARKAGKTTEPLTASPAGESGQGGS